MKKCNYVAKKEAKEIRKEIWSVLSKTNKGLKNTIKDFKYTGFTNRIVGSSKRNMIFRYGESIYDTDIQIEYNGKKTREYPNNFKLLFYTELSNHLPDNWTSEISTSVITINKLDSNHSLLHSFDFAIIRVNGDKREINKGKNPDNNSNDKFVWNEMSNFNPAYTKWKRAKKDEVKKVKALYLVKRCNRHNQDINKNDAEYITSSSLFIQSVNEIIE